MKNRYWWLTAAALVFFVISVVWNAGQQFQHWDELRTPKEKFLQDWASLVPIAVGWVFLFFRGKLHKR